MNPQPEVISPTEQTDPLPTPLSRRTVLRCAAICGAAIPLLVACGSDDESPSAAAKSSPQDSTESASPDDSGSEGGLVEAANVPVDGGVILDSIIVTQPSKGTFVGYRPVCTHQGGALTSVKKGVITCSLHGSQFSIKAGENVKGPSGGPAGSTADLTPIPLKLQGDEVVRA